MERSRVARPLANDDGKPKMKIHNSSAVEFLSGLPTASVGALVSDPPFHISINHKGPKRGFGADPWTDVSSFDGVIEWTRPHVEQAARVIRPGGAMVIMGSTQSLAGWDYCCSKYGFQWMAELIILWNAGKPRIQNFGSLHTRVVWYNRVGLRHAFNTNARTIYSNILVCRKIPFVKRRHPSEKPVSVTNFIVSLLTNEGDLVVDPFAGSASTLVSAVQCGRRWAGSEMDAGYATAANTRMEDADDEESEPIYLWINGKLQEV